MDELILNLLELLGSLLDTVLDRLGPSFDGIAGMLQLCDHIIERFGELSQFIVGPNGYGLIEISIGGLLGCSAEFIDGPIDKSSDQKAEEKAEKDDTDEARRDHLTVDAGPLFLKFFQTDRRIQNPEDAERFGVAWITGGFIIDGIDQSQEALVILFINP